MHVFPGTTTSKASKYAYVLLNIIKVYLTTTPYTPIKTNPFPHFQSCKFHQNAQTLQIDACRETLKRKKEKKVELRGNFGAK